MSISDAQRAAMEAYLGESGMAQNDLAYNFWLQLLTVLDSENGGFDTGALGFPVFTRSYIPRLIAPTFTGGASGAITLGTALPETYPECFLFFDENTLWVTLDEDEITIIDGNIAGFYYCEMTSTTEGTVYNNIFVPTVNAVPTVPTTLVPFVDPIIGGDGSTSQVLFDKCTVPANFINPQGIINFDGCIVGVSNNYSVEMQIGGVPFLILLNFSPDTLGLAQTVNLFAQGDDNIRVLQAFAGLSATLSAPLDLTVANDIDVYLQNTNATDYSGLLNYGAIGDVR